MKSRLQSAPGHAVDRSDAKNRRTAWFVSTSGREEARRLRRAQRGDLQAFAELFEPLRSKALTVAARIVGPQHAEDVVMDAFLLAWRALPDFRGHARLSTWVLRIVRNRALDILRASRIRQADPLDAAGGEDTPPPAPVDWTAPSPSEIVEQRDLSRHFERALASLPPVHRQCLLHRYVDGLSYREIAAATGVSIGTVMSRLFHARRKLLAALRAAGVDGLPDEVISS